MRFRGVMAPNAKLRALVLPLKLDPPEQATRGQALKAACRRPTVTVQATRRIGPTDAAWRQVIAR
jgi:hypothetical protein